MEFRMDNKPLSSGFTVVIPSTISTQTRKAMTKSNQSAAIIVPAEDSVVFNLCPFLPTTLLSLRRPIGAPSSAYQWLVPSYGTKIRLGHCAQPSRYFYSGSKSANLFSIFDVTCL